MVEITDMTARLVLGDGNMDEWNHARYLSTLNIIYWFDSLFNVTFACKTLMCACYCSPHKRCNEPFDANDVARAVDGVSHPDCLVQVR